MCNIGLVIEDEFLLGLLKDLKSKAGKRMRMLFKKLQFLNKENQLLEQILHVSD
jgi:hypothetical protein